MFGRQRLIPYSQHSIYPTPNYHPVGSNNYVHYGISARNFAYPQTEYNPFINGGTMGSVPNLSNYSNPNGIYSMNHNWQAGANGYGQNQYVSQLLFENPLQPQPERPYGSSFYQQEMPFQNMNPYPQQSYIPKPSSGFHSVVNSFKNQQGNIDLNKMIDTAGQMMNAVTQVSSMVKGLGGIFKA